MSPIGVSFLRFRASYMASTVHLNISKHVLISRSTGGLSAGYGDICACARGHICSARLRRRKTKWSNRRALRVLPRRSNINPCCRGVPKVVCMPSQRLRRRRRDQHPQVFCSAIGHSASNRNGQATRHPVLSGLPHTDGVGQNLKDHPQVRYSCVLGVPAAAAPSNNGGEADL